MQQPSAARDIAKLVHATAKAMALVEHQCGTPRMAKLYIDDARKVLRSIDKFGKRENWTCDELALSLDPPKPRVKR